MLRGHIDALTSSGYIEGWAFDDEAPLQPLVVCVMAGSAEVALGIASRYRWDLAEDGGFGTGWCAFRLRVSGPAEALRDQPLALLEASAQIEIQPPVAATLAEDSDMNLSELDAIVLADPTLVHRIEQLSGCGRVFADFIAAAGLEAFVRAGYVYVLGRPADHAGMSAYVTRLGNQSIAPWDFIKELYDSAEFNAAPRLLAAPSEPGFAFRRS